MNQLQFNPNTNIENKYAQLVSSIIGPFDATLIFYEVNPIRTEVSDDGKIENYIPVQREIARVTMPLQILEDFSIIINNQIKQLKTQSKNNK